MYPKLLRFTILIMTILFIGSSFSYASEAKTYKAKQVILVLINTLSLTDSPLYSELKGFKTLENNGAKGLMNINSSGGRTDVNSYLTIGVGSKANGMKDLAKAYMAYENPEANSISNAKEIYQQQTGNVLSQEDTIVMLNLKRLYSVQQKFPVFIGAFGEQLKQNNLSARVYGNNDTTEKIRLAPLITMDARGVSYGDVSERTLLWDKTRPFGVRTDYDYLLTQINNRENKASSLLVFDLGDLYRLEEFKPQMSEQYETEVRKKVLKEMGEFIEKIINGLENHQYLIVTSPMVNNEAVETGYLLSPIWTYHNHQTTSILTSGTTRREAIVGSIDLLPTILKELGVSNIASQVLGKKIEEKKGKIDIKKEMTHIATIYRLRQSVLYTYVMWQIAVLIIAMVYWFKKDFVGKKIVLAGLLSILYLPIILLISAFITPNHVMIYLSIMFIIGLFLGYISEKISTKYIFSVIGFITFFIISIDIINKSELMKRSFLGYDPIIGARYYGIGNEYMGIYIGSAILFTSAVLQVKRSITSIGFSLFTYFFVIVVLLSPALGTNAGGAITAIIAMGFTFLKAIHIKWGKREAFFFIFFIILGGFILIGVNVFTPTNQQSHIGTALQELFAGNTDTILQTIKRKISMNWKLIQVSSWSKVLITSLIAIGIMLLKNNFRSLRIRYPNLFNGFYGIVIGAFIALLINDSGIVAAATMIIYVAVPILYLAMKEQQELKG